MTEYSARRGYDGKDLFCAFCNRECTYITETANDMASQGQSKALTFGGGKQPEDQDQDAASDAGGVDAIMRNIMKKCEQPLETRSIQSQALPNNNANSSFHDFDNVNTITSKGIYF